jgi:pilus assembly protein CpaB
MQRSLTSLIAGVVLGVVAVLLMALYLRSERPGVQAQQLAAIVVSGADFTTGAPIRPEMLKVAQWPVGSVPDGAFTNVNDIYRGSTVPEDRVALKVLKSGEPILRTNISGFGGRATLSREVARGMRAVSISINDVSGVAGFILPGDHVDVMLTRQIVNGGPEPLATDVILQNITVLGIDQLTDQERDKPQVARTVTVEVTTEQAQKLALAQQAGTLGLALRNAETLDQQPASRVKIPDLYGTPKPAQHVRHTAAAGPSVRIRYGDEGAVEKAIPSTRQ